MTDILETESEIFCQTYTWIMAQYPHLSKKEAYKMTSEFINAYKDDYKESQR
jgi:hypothetical protein